MKLIKVTESPLMVNSGQVQLTAEQVRSRRHALAPVKVGKDGAGTYEVTAPLQFKRGEQLGYSGEVGKNGIAFDPEAEARTDRERVNREAKLRSEFEARVRHELQDEFDEKLKAARAEIEGGLKGGTTGTQNPLV